MAESNDKNKNSQEEKWLNNAIKTIDNVLWINNITEINN